MSRAPFRKHGAVNKDRYYTIRYKVDGKDREEGVGWASEGKTPEKAYDILRLNKDNIRNGTGPQSYEALRAENRGSDIRKKEQEEEEEKSEPPCYVGYLHVVVLRPMVLPNTRRMQ